MPTAIIATAEKSRNRLRRSSTACVDRRLRAERDERDGRALRHLLGGDQVRARPSGSSGPSTARKRGPCCGTSSRALTELGAITRPLATKTKRSPSSSADRTPAARRGRRRRARGRPPCRRARPRPSTLTTRNGARGGGGSPASSSFLPCRRRCARRPSRSGRAPRGSGSSAPAGTWVARASERAVSGASLLICSSKSPCATRIAVERRASVEPVSPRSATSLNATVAATSGSSASSMK